MFWIDEPGSGKKNAQNRWDTYSNKGASAGAGAGASAGAGAGARAGAGASAGARAGAGAGARAGAGASAGARAGAGASAGTTAAGAAGTGSASARALGLALDAQTRKSDKEPNKSEKVPNKPGVFFLFFGVFLPLSAALIEFNFHVCAQLFFDPFPTINHFYLFLLIPLSNFMAFLSGRLDMSEHYGFMALASGMSVGIAILYSLMFLPIIPLSLIAILFLGIGLLGLSPMFSIPATMRAGGYVCHRAKLHKTYFDAHHAKHLGHLIILVTVVAVELPSTLTRIHLAQAADLNNAATARAAVQWLRQWGNQEVMLRACYERSGRATDIVGSLYESQHPLNIEDARRIFYKVTGKPFNSVPLPTSARATIQNTGLISDPDGLNSDVQDEFDLDPDIAGETISGVARGLALSKSSIKGFIDTHDAVADLTWTFALNNSSRLDREARVKVQMPPGAVLTHAFVTIDDKEREATIMGRSAAREVYHQAVVEHRNPMLVSMSGPDQILMQCYPVRPGRETAIRLVMAAPLEGLERQPQSYPDKASLVLPSFSERNFQADCPHQLDVKTDSAKRFFLESGSSVSGTASGNGNNVVTEINNSQLARSSTKLVLEAPMGLLRQLKYPNPEHLTVVIDGSIAMEPYFKATLDELYKLRMLGVVNPELSLYFIGDATKRFQKFDERAMQELKTMQCVGGQDNAEMLDELSSTMDKTNPILWIHAAQPVVDVNHQNAIRSRLSQFSEGPVFYDFQVASGPNEALAGVNSSPMDGDAVLVRLTGLDSLRNHWFSISGTSDLRESTTKPPGARYTDLVAYNKILQLLQSNPDDPGKQYEAAEIAVKHHLITPVTSGVVDDVIEPTPLPASNTPAFFESINRMVSADAPGLFRGAQRLTSAPESSELYESAVPSNAPSEDAVVAQSAEAEESVRSELGATSQAMKENKADLRAKMAPETNRADGREVAQKHRSRRLGKSLQFADEKDFASSSSNAVKSPKFKAPNAALDMLLPKVVPESDTWLLLGVAFIVLSGGLFFRFRPLVRKA